MTRCGNIVAYIVAVYTAAFSDRCVDAALLRYTHRLEQANGSPRLAVSNATREEKLFWEKLPDVDVPGAPVKRGGNPMKKKGSRSNDGEVSGMCYAASHADASNDADAWCPKSCPYRVQDFNAEGFCNFQCVRAPDCASVNPETPLAEASVGACLPCTIEGCAKCDGRNKCQECAAGYRLDSAGICRTRFWWIWLALFGIVAVGIVAIAVWVIDLAFRPVRNPGALRRGLRYRSRSKLQRTVDDQPSTGRSAESDGSHVLATHPAVRHCEFWPLRTNPHSNEVAGPGWLLHMNFQAMLLMWGSLVAIVWVILAYAVDTDLLVVGTKPALTPRMSCILISWGHEVTHRLAWAKHGFCWFVYGATTIMALLFAIYQRRQFAKLDRQPRMSHYAALCTGLPQQTGNNHLEAPLKDHLEKELNMKIIGVSMCWAYEDKAENISAALDVHSEIEREDWFDRHKSRLPADQLTAEEAEQAASGSAGAMHRKLEAVERKILGYESEEPLKLPTKEQLREDILPVLQGLTSGGMAFVVFNTEKDRDDAVDKVTQNSITYLDQTIALEKVEVEPATVNWENMARHNTESIFKYTALGIVEILCAILFWVVFFYTPWAYFLLTADYQTGEEPGVWRSFALAMVITIGNQFVYYVCADAAARLKWRYTDDFEACYMVFYFVAIMLQSLLDFYVTYNMSYMMMVGSHVTLHDGTPIEDAGHFFDIFQTYAMQRELGKQLYIYFGSFIAPFVLEPLVMVIVPLVLGVFIVKAHPEITGLDAEKLLAGPPMDLSRYADLLVNVGVVVLVFYFPGGFILKIFVTLVALHLFIYAYDHYRVLRCMQQCWYSNMDVEICTQYMFSAVCAIMLSCAVFKTHTYLPDETVTGFTLFMRCSVAFAGHVVLHCLVLRFVVPRLAATKETDERDEQQRTVPYRETAERLPTSWFNANPVHCLRSQFVHNTSPHCVYCIPGKEHLLRFNEKAHLYYKQDQAEVEDYDLKEQLKYHLGHLKTAAITSVHSMKFPGSPSSSPKEEVKKDDASEK